VTKIEALQARFLAQVLASAELKSPAWKQAFERVPRHPFVPRIVGCWPPLAGETDVLFDRDSDPDRWLELVYSDRLLLIADDGERQSSSSRPSVMARFLELLDIQDGNSVLEIGTGSGYNAAILCEWLGSERVTSIDIDGELVEEARRRLGSCGYRPTLAVADGWDGYPAGSPFDRIQATCSVPRVPDAWTRQLRPGGVIVTPLRGGRFDAAGLVALRLRDDGSLVGRLHPKGAAFMPMRRETERSDKPDRGELRKLLAKMDGEARAASIPRWLVDESEDSLAPHFFLRLHETEDWEWFWLRESEAGFKMPAVTASDGSWARIVTRVGTQTDLAVVQGGRRRLWDLIEQANERWLSLGRPDMGRYGITVTVDRRQHLWLDDPNSQHVWEL